MMRRATLHRSMLLVACFSLPVLAGCRIDMHDQPKYETYEASTLFADSSSARQPPEGTVPRTEWGKDSVMETGYDLAGELLAKAPIEINERVLKRGEQRYGMFCGPCHGALGDGLGMIVRRGYKQPPSFHEDRLRTESDGYYFDVITRGFGQMPNYAAQIKVEDRWAIVTYVRALQLSQGAVVDGELRDEVAEQIAAARENHDESTADHAADGESH